VTRGGAEPRRPGVVVDQLGEVARVVGARPADDPVGRARRAHREEAAQVGQVVLDVERRVPHGEPGGEREATDRALVLARGGLGGGALVGLGETDLVADDRQGRDEPLHVELEGAAVGLVEVVDVEHQPPLGRREDAEVGRVRVTAERHVDPGRGPGHQVVGHHQGRAAQEGKRPDGHARDAQRGQGGDPGLRLGEQPADRVVAGGPVGDGAERASRNDRAHRAPGPAALGHAHGATATRSRDARQRGPSRPTTRALITASHTKIAPGKTAPSVVKCRRVSRVMTQLTAPVTKTFADSVSGASHDLRTVGSAATWSALMNATIATVGSWMTAQKTIPTTETTPQAASKGPTRHTALGFQNDAATTMSGLTPNISVITAARPTWPWTSTTKASTPATPQSPHDTRLGWVSPRSVART
jgi:hypothetical protein